MTWEAFGAIATAFTGIVIMATVIVGARQARAALEQISETHQATQLDAMMRVFELFDDERFVRGRQFIMHELSEKMADPEFEKYLRTSNPADLPWAKPLMTLERVAVFIRLGLLEGEPLYYNWSNMIIVTWQKLRPLVELQRKLQDNPYLWKDTEWMADDAARWARKYVAENPRPRPSTGEPFTLDALQTRSR
jgi:hypothetical protein